MIQPQPPPSSHLALAWMVYEEGIWLYYQGQVFYKVKPRTKTLKNSRVWNVILAFLKLLWQFRV